MLYVTNHGPEAALLSLLLVLVVVAVVAWFWFKI